MRRAPSPNYRSGTRLHQLRVVMDLAARVRHAAVCHASIMSRNPDLRRSYNGAPPGCQLTWGASTASQDAGEDRSRELGRGHHSRRPRKRNCDWMRCSSSCARSSPARPLLGLLMWSLSIRRSAAATRSRARSKSATVYCRGPGRMRFPCRPFDALLAGIAALNRFAAAIWPLRLSKRTASIKTYSVRLRERSRGNLGVHGI